MTPRSSTIGHASRGAAAAVALVTLLCSGCGSATGAAGTRSAEPLDLEGRSFTATEVNGWDLVPGTTVVLNFEDGRVAGQAGCNNLMAGADWADGNLDLEGPLATTMMACDEALEAQDRWLIDLLESDPALSLDGDTLVIGTETNGMVMKEDR